MSTPFLIVGSGGQIGHDVRYWLRENGYQFDCLYGRLTDLASVERAARDYPGHQVINLAFDISLRDRFTNVELPKLIERSFQQPPIVTSSNAVYGLKARHVGLDDEVDAFNLYAEQKLEAEGLLERSIIVRGSFLSSSHRIFQNERPQIHDESLWNGITAFEFSRLVAEGKFSPGISVVASERVMKWREIVEHFHIDAAHNGDLLNNKCLLSSSITEVRDLTEQFTELSYSLKKPIL